MTPSGAALCENRPGHARGQGECWGVTLHAHSDFWVLWLSQWLCAHPQLNYAESRLTQLEGCHCERTCSANGLVYRDKELWVEPENCRNCACKVSVILILTSKEWPAFNFYTVKKKILRQIEDLNLVSTARKLFQPDFLQPSCWKNSVEICFSIVRWSHASLDFSNPPSPFLFSLVPLRFLTIAFFLFLKNFLAFVPL